MKIILTHSNLQDLNNNGETIIKGIAKIKLIGGDENYTEPTTLDLIYLSITRLTLVKLLTQEVEIDGITLKLE